MDSTRLSWTVFYGPWSLTATLGSIELDGTTHLSPLWVNNRYCPVPVSTGWKQDAQILTNHGGCLSTSVVLYQCSRVKVPIHTGVVRSWVSLGVLPFRCQGTSIWVSTGPIFVYLPSLRCLKRYPRCCQGVAVDITFKGCNGTHVSRPTKAFSPVSSSSCCPATLRSVWRILRRSRGSPHW